MGISIILRNNFDASFTQIKKMYQKLLFITLMLSGSMLYVSCSSDPCEAVTCVNGSCNEGICDCAEGWKGPSCSEIDYDFIGEYRSSSLSLAECPNPSDDFTRLTNEDNEICTTDAGITTCLEVLLRLEEDQTFFLNVILSRTNGSISTGDPTVTRGNYTISDNIVTLCENASVCNTMSLDMSQQILTWDQRPSSSTECAIRWELARQ